MFSAIRTFRASDEIAKEIRLAILTGRLTPGDRLPSEHRLAKQFGVSKATLREALKSLETFGLLQRRAGRDGGAFVRTVTPEKVQDAFRSYLYFQRASVQDLFDARKLIEGEIVARVAERVTPALLARLRESVEALREEVEAGGDGGAEKIRFHLLLAAALDNPILKFMMEFLLALLAEFKGTVNLPSSISSDILEEHLALYEALVRREGEAAKSLLLKHLDHTFQTIALVNRELITGIRADGATRGEGPVRAAATVPGIGATRNASRPRRPQHTGHWTRRRLREK